uniref:Uncharacterized protein n=1 Tax=Avena sativa TaxID=4498 RepID=A0ACD5X0I4_AVESA
MEKSPATAACHLELIFEDQLGIVIFFTMLTWSISMLQRFLPSSCQSCTCPVTKTTSTPALANTQVSKALDKNDQQDEIDTTQSDAEVAMRKLGFSFDQQHSAALNAISSESISTLFVDDEPSLQEVKMAFLLFDENNDGYIDASDLQRVLGDLGLGEGVGLNECEQMIARYDTDDDMRIDIMEFSNVLEASFC